MLLILAVVLLVGQGESVKISSQGLDGDEGILYFQPSLNSSRTTRAGTESCVEGKCYKNEEFYSRTETVNEILKIVDPLGELNCPEDVDLSSVAGQSGYDNSRKICSCHCKAAHGASESKICQRSSSSNGPQSIPCLCIYTKQDKEKLPCLKNAQPAQRDNGRVLAIVDEVCENVNTFIVQLECSAVLEKDGKQYKLEDCVVTLADVCALDCYFAHGARVFPYGICVQSKSSENDKEIVQLCVCLY